MKVGDKVIAKEKLCEKFKFGERVTVIQTDGNLELYLVSNGHTSAWLYEEELHPVEELSESDPILFVRLYDGIWETNVEGLVVVYENIVTKPLETTGRYILIDGDYIYLNDQETCAYEKALEVLTETTISQVEVPLSKGKLIVNKNSTSYVSNK